MLHRALDPGPSKRPLGLLAVAALLIAGCGSARPPARTPTHLRAAAHRPSFADRAEQAWKRGDLEGAATAAANALQLHPDDRRGLAIAARVDLARGRNTEAIRTLAGTHDPELVRLRAHAYLALGNLGAVARDLGEIAEGTPGPVLAMARAGAGHPIYRLEGTPEATVPFVADASLPVVAIGLGDRTVHALVATSTDVMVVDRSVQAAGGLVDRLSVGTLVVRDVPFLSGDVRSLATQVGTPIDVVMGTDLLLRLHATIDGRAKALTVRAQAPDPGATATMPFVTLDGAHMLVLADLDGFVGWFTLDTAGLFPVAVSAEALVQMGLAPGRLHAVPQAPSPDVKLFTIAHVRIGSTQIDGVPGVTGLVPPSMARDMRAPVAGMIGDQIWSELRITFDPDQRLVRVK